MAIESHRDLLVWQKSMDLVVETYRLVKSFPKDEQWALSDQLRRAVVSIPANIAEGHGRGRMFRKDYARFLSIARGSLMEVDTHLQVALRLGYLSKDQLANVYTIMREVGRMLSALVRSLESHTDTSRNNHLRERYEPYTLDWPDLEPNP